MTEVIVTFPPTSSLVDSRLIIRGLLCLAGLLLASNSLAFIDLRVEETRAHGWQITGLEISINTPVGGQQQLSLKLQELSLQGQSPLTDLSIQCTAFQLSTSLFECQQGHFTAQHQQLASIHGEISISYDMDSEVLQAELHALQLANSRWQLELFSEEENWTVSVRSEDVDLVALDTLVRALYPGLQGYSLSAGEAQLVAEFSGQGGDIQQTDIQARVQALDVAANNGINSSQTEKLGFKLGLRLDAATQQAQQAWQVTADLVLNDGLAYLEPGFSIGEIMPGFYLELQDSPIQTALALRWFAGQSQLAIQSLSFNHQDVMQVDSHGSVSLQLSPQLSDMHFAVTATDLQALYAQWLQPLLLDTTFNVMQTSGGLQAEVRVQDNHLTDVTVAFDQVYLDDQQGRFNLYGLDGEMILNSAASPATGQLSWLGAGVYKLDFGATDLHLQSSHGRIKLASPADIPVLDGVLKIEGLELDNPGEEEMHFYLDGILTPVSLEAFSQAMGWPIMAGKLSGIIPGLRYARHRISMDGNLLVRAFEGSIPIRGLVVNELFGQVPKLEADIDIHRLNLETLTSTFSFGKITGLLDGYIHDLKLEAWQPVSFDARFTNPEDDDSAHRISRRAVDDLTSIGGGIPALGASSRFISLFDEFSYGELGLSCRLQKGVCEMGGVSDSTDSYSILTHGLFPPWIDIKGFNRQVDWSVLVERLRDIARGEAPVIQ